MLAPVTGDAPTLDAMPGTTIEDQGGGCPVGEPEPTCPCILLIEKWVGYQIEGNTAMRQRPLRAARAWRG